MRFLRALPAGLVVVGCAGLFGPVTETEAVQGRGDISIPSPSAALVRGFPDPAHRARVEDALCQGEPAVWGELEQAVSTSLRKGEVFADVTGRYAGLVDGCMDRGYCGWARTRYPNSVDSIQAFWLHVLAHCGDLQDRPRFRDLDVEPRAVAAFYTSGALPPHREPADDGALLLATERLLARGANEDVLRDAIWGLLRLDDPEAAELFSPMVSTVNLDLRDELLKGLAGQSAEAAIEAVQAACAATPDKEDVCGVSPKPVRPDPKARWLAAVGAATRPDVVQHLIDSHPEWLDEAREHLRDCGAPCAGPASLVSGDSALAEHLDQLGVVARPDRAGHASFTDNWTHALAGRGRAMTLHPNTPNDQIMRRMARLLELDPAEVFFHDVIDDEGVGSAAVEWSGRRFEIPAGPSDPESCVTLVNHVLTEMQHEWRILLLDEDVLAAAPLASVEPLREAIAAGP